MTEEIMQVSLSNKAADARWGKAVLVSSNDQGITVHLNATVNGTKLNAIQCAARKIAVQGIKKVKLAGAGWQLEESWVFWQGFRDAKKQHRIEWAALSVDECQELKWRLKTIDWLRDTINMPAEDLSPEQLAAEAISLMKNVTPEGAFNYQIIKGENLHKQKYHGIYTVGRGSDRPPLLLILDYNPSRDASVPVFACLVGKGITFDSGGYSLKPSSAMDSMKSDMGGAATVTAGLALAAARGLRQRVKLYLCCADNMVSGNAFRLGDIIHYRNGKTVEVMNTDAEGRLVLADGLIDAAQQNAPLIIDAATLTGAAKVALGNDYHALFSFDDQLVQQMLISANSENEPFWRLPLAEFHRQQLPSQFAQLNNVAIPSATGGASTAAAFLSHFVKNYQQGWLHIDCSATYRKTAVEQWAAGATGLGARTLANLLIARAK